MAGTINDITNLKFYTAKGYEIPVQKSYTLTWEFKPGNLASQYIQQKLSGYFIGDVEFSDNKISIKPASLLTSFINNGEFYVRFATEDTTDKNNMPVYSYDDIDASTGLLDAEEYYNYIKTLLTEDDNNVVVSINVKNQSFTHTFKFNDIFELNADNNYEEYTVVKTIYTGENINNSEFFQTIGLSKIDLIKLGESSYIQTVFENSVPTIGNYFPFVSYAGDFYQDKVSSDFIAADTLLVLEEVRNEDETFNYVKPYINSQTPYSLVFQPANNSEIKIIDENSEYNILYKSEAAFSLSNEQNNLDIAQPFSFAIAFQAKEEGAYQNLLGIYLRSQDNPNIVFFMGAISVKSEVEGEDERFRTLLTNFGVPDPIYYSNIFAEQDYQEEGKDFKLINRKSKEMMLSYEQIFSYVGTYKALIRAIKFLGYQDIVFKEWYTVKDTNDKLTDIAVQVFDSSNGNFLKQKLADYGISIEDFNNYNKLNRLSMIYHLNEQSDEVEKIKVSLCHYDPSTHKIVSDETTGIKRTFISEVPLTQPVYAYRNTETLAKLYAVKQWLEQHIIGVGAYIADITGEGIYFGWQKTQGYQTQHHLNDFSQEQYYTPDVKEISEFIDSSAIISCTLTELNNSIRFIDYDEIAIDAFDKYDVSINLETTDGIQINTSTLTISNSIEAPVLGDEYEFNLVNKPDSGTLYDWSDKNDSSSQILIQDGEIKFLFDKTTESFIDSSCLPIITLENANIHNAYGKWRNNIKWLIREVTDPETGNIKYLLKNYKYFLSTSNQKIANQYVILEPAANDAYIKYSEKNKWNIPMFIIHGYKFANIDISTNEYEYYNLESSASDYILEIIKGDFLFKQVGNCGCQLSFDSDSLKSANANNYVNEQIIQPIYTYHSDRKAFINIDASTIESEAANTQVDCSADIEYIVNITRDSMNSMIYHIATDIHTFNSGVSADSDIALQDALNFIDSSDYLNEQAEFIQMLTDAKKQELLDKTLEQIIADNYLCNNKIDVDVNHLGEYDIIVKAFDKYNNIFTAKYDNTANVTAAPIAIDSYIYNENSNNTKDFYKYNIDGKLIDSSIIIDDIIENCDEQPKYPKSYHISDIDYNLKNNSVLFDNISYAIDTPKNNDYIIFDTLNERCVDISVNDSTIRLWMLDENPNKIFLFANIPSGMTKKVSVFVYDKILKEFVYSLENCIVVDSFLVNQEDDINYEADSYIDIINDTDNEEILSYLNDNYNIYVLNTTEYDISTNIQLNYDTKKSYIAFKGDQIFNNEDVIKLRYYLDVSVNNSSNGYINVSSGQIINETAYRIIDVNIDSSENTYTYVINGLPNEHLLNNENVHMVIMYAAQYPVKYTTKVIGDATEFNEIIGFNNYSILRDQLTFNSTQLFLNDYLDDTYGIEINDYDPVNLENYWVDFTQFSADSSNMNLYYYHQFPITSEQGYDIIYKSHDINNTFLPDYKIDWRVSNYSVDELDNISENINNIQKETLFRSINNYLTIKPYMLGSHNIELTCTDIYGNRLVNKGEGLLYIKPNTETDKYTNYGYI